MTQHRSSRRQQAIREPSWWRADLIRLLYQVRLATTNQLTRLLNTGTSKRVWTVLDDLTNDGLVDAVRVRRQPGSTKAWFLTPAGAELAETAAEVVVRPYRMRPDAAAGPAQAHMLAVTETGCLFVEHARARGDDCGPLDWDVEVAHRTRDGAAPRSPADLLITDAVLHYTATASTGTPTGAATDTATAHGRRRMFTFFLEIDRATMSTARLARKIDHYARYYTHTPGNETANSRRPRARRRTTNEQTEYGWRRLYPVFPKLVIVLTGAPEPALTERIADLRARCLANTRLLNLADQITAGAVTLTALRDHGPFTPIVHRLLTPDPGPVDITMRETP